MCVYVLVNTGQSNSSHPARGESGTLSAVRYFLYSKDRPSAESSGDVFIDLVGMTADTGGYDYTIGRRLNAAGLTVAIIQLTMGSSFYNDWQNGAPEQADLLAHFDTALSLLRAQYPGETEFRFIHVRNQGTSDMRQNNLQYQTGFAPGTIVGSDTVGAGSYPGWAVAALQWHSALEGRIAAAGFEQPSMTKLCVQAYTGLSAAFFTPAIERQQLTYVGGTPTVDTTQIGTHANLITTENAAAFDADGVHMKAGSIVIGGVTYSGGGYHWAGERIADRLLEIIFMGSISDDLSNKLLDHALGGGDYSPLTNIYAACFVSGVEATQIAREQIANNTTNFPNLSSRLKRLAIGFSFANASGDAGWIDEIRLFSASSGGVELARDSITPVLINDGGILDVQDNQLSFLFSAGCMSDYLAGKLADLAFGAVAYSRPATVYIASYSGNPQGAGTQLHPTRVSVTNNATNWPAATSRTKSLGVIQAHASTSSNLGTADYVAIFDASSGGNLMFSAALSSSVAVNGTSVAKTLKYRPNELSFAIAA